nr:putative ribonuclease H-like domain-containing protein [Tanacetum cinerariifolium]
MCVLQPVAPTTTKQKLAKKNELKAHGTLLMALPNKHQLKFNSHKDAKTLMDAIKKRFKGNTETKKIDVDDLEEMDLRWQMAMLTIRARRFIQKTGINLSAKGPTSMSFDMSKVKCYNCHRKGHFARECRSPKDSRRHGAAEPQRRTAEEEPANYALMAFSSLSSCADNDVFTCAMFDCDDYLSSESDYESWPPGSLYDRFLPSDRYHVVPPPYIGTFMPPKPDLVFNTTPTAVVTDHPAFSVQLSPTKPEQDLSHTNRPTALIIEDWVFDSEDEYETKAPPIVPSFVQSFEQVKSPRHSVQPVETSIHSATHKPASLESASSGKRRNRKACFVCKSVNHLIKDYDYHAKKWLNPHQGPMHTRSKPVSITAVRPVSAVVPKIKVTRPRLAHPIVTKSKSPIKRHITRSPSPKTSTSPPRVTAVKSPVGNPQHILKDNGVIDSGCSRHMTRNMSYLSNFEELNGGYVAFGGNPKGGKISRKGKIKTDSLLPIPFWSKAVNTTCYVQNRLLVTKPHNKTPYELLHSRTPSIGFMRPFGCPVTILNTLDSLGKFEGKVDEGFLVGYSVRSKVFRVFNSRTCIVQETLHVNFLKNKPNVASSGPTWLFDIDSLTKTMNYQPVIAGNQTNLSTGFQDKFVAEKAREEIDQQYVLFPVWSYGFTNPHNNDGDAAFDGKEPDFDVKKPESKVNVSLSSSAQSRKQDDKTKKEAKGKSHVESFIGYRDLSVEFKDCTNNSINKVNATGSIILTVGRNPRGYIKLLKIQVGLKLCRKSFFNSRCIKFRSWLICQLEKELLEEGIDYKEVFALVARIEDIRLFLAYASFMGFMVYQMDVKSVFLYGTIKEEVYVCQPPGSRHFIVYIKLLELDDIIFGATNKDSCKYFEKLMKEEFQMSLIGELTFFLGLQVKQNKNGLFVSQDKYVAEILRKFRLTERKLASTPIDIEKTLQKDPNGEDVDVHIYRSMIGLLMYLTSSRPDIMFAVCACAHFQVTPNASHLHAVKRIFRYLKGKPYLGLWYPKNSPFDLVAYSDSDYAGASLDRKSTTRECQFLGCRLISWQCKKQTVVATSSIEAEYVAAASCCA